MDSRYDNGGVGSGRRGNLWNLDHQLDEPIGDVEASSLKSGVSKKKISTLKLLQLSFQSLGVVYGDLGTSPLYVFYNTFPSGIKEEEDLIGALSLIVYSLTLITLIKYVFIVSRANDHGQGGTFALYSFLCRHAKIKTIENQELSDEELTTYKRNTAPDNSVAARTKSWLETGAVRKMTLLILVLIGSCMVIGDGILTPAISVLSAVDGINVDHSRLETRFVVIIAVSILVVIFTLQHHGTEKVGSLFAPIVFVWFLFIGGIGIFNLYKHNAAVLRAFSPIYMYRYLKRGRANWESVGGIVLCITGTEALFADLSHFPIPAIQIAFTVFVFPCLILSYTGQAAYLLDNPDNVFGVFYRCIPEKLYWPAFAVATLASTVASQATISATFSLIKQALALGCFPRVKVVHTSKNYYNQIYIPDINWILMALCIAVTAGFQDQNLIGNALGTAFVIVMVDTTFLMILVMILVWRCHWTIVVFFTVISLAAELTYLSAVLLKVHQGGWVPLVIAAAFFVIMYVWHYGRMKQYEFEIQSKIPITWILKLGPSLGLERVPGIGLVYTELPNGIPHIFSHFITNLPAIHSVVVFVCIKNLPVQTVPPGERFLVKHIGPKNFQMFRCVARYGYIDLHDTDDDFERNLIDSLFRFVRFESMLEGCSDTDEYSSVNDQRSEHSIDELENDIGNLHMYDNISTGDSSLLNSSASTGIISAATSKTMHSQIDDVEFLRICKDAGVAHILGNTVVQARTGSNFVKGIVINYMYAFLRNICRENKFIFNVPQESLLSVGQICSI